MSNRFFVIGGKFLNITDFYNIRCKSNKKTRIRKQKSCNRTKKHTFWQKNDIFFPYLFVELENCCNFACKLYCYTKNNRV